MKMLKNRDGLDYVPMHTARKTQKQVRPKKKQPHDTERGPEPDRSIQFKSFTDREGLEEIDTNHDQKKMFLQW